MYESKITVWVGVWRTTGGYRRVKKLWVEEELTERFHRERYSPCVGYILPSGDVVVEKGSDSDSIILFINEKQKTK